MSDCLDGSCLELKRKRVEEAKENPVYRELLEVFSRLIDLTESAIDRVRPDLKPVVLTPYVEEKFREGLPLVDRKNFPVPEKKFELLMDIFLKGLMGIGDSVDRDLHILIDKRLDGRLRGRQFIEQFVMGSHAFLGSVFEIPDINNHLLFLVLRNIFKICLIPFQDTLTEELAIGWESGKCPVCGFPPDMGVLRGEGGKLYLHCAICGHEWRFKRMTCAYCGQELQKELRYLEVEGDGIHRIHLCHLCKRYLKIVDERNLPESMPLFLDLEELITHHLDIIAEQQGYIPGIQMDALAKDHGQNVSGLL